MTMEVNDFRRLIQEEEFTCEEGGCALAFAADSEGESTAFIKGDATSLHQLLFAAMKQSNPIRGCILRAANQYKKYAEEVTCIL